MTDEQQEQHDDKIRADYFERTKEDRAAILQVAQEAFWEVIADQYPDAERGDFMPDAACALDNALESALEHWLTMNLPLSAMEAK